MYTLIVLAPLAPLNHLTVSTNNFVSYSQSTDNSESDSFRFASGLVSLKQYSSYLLRLLTVSLYLHIPRFRPFHLHRYCGVILLLPPPLHSASLSLNTLLDDYLLVGTFFYVFFFFKYFQPLSNIFIILGYINISSSSLLPHFFGYQYVYRSALFQHFSDINIFTV